MFAGEHAKDENFGRHNGTPQATGGEILVFTHGSRAASDDRVGRGSPRIYLRTICEANRGRMRPLVTKTSLRPMVQSVVTMPSGYWIVTG